MPRYIAAAFAAIGVGIGLAGQRKLASLNADDRRVSGPRGPLAIAAAALADEDALAGDPVANRSTEAPTLQLFNVGPHPTFLPAIVLSLRLPHPEACAQARSA